MAGAGDDAGSESASVVMGKILRDFHPINALRRQALFHFRRLGVGTSFGFRAATDSGRPASPKTPPVTPLGLEALAVAIEGSGDSGGASAGAVVDDTDESKQQQEADDAAYNARVLAKTETSAAV